MKLLTKSLYKVFAKIWSQETTKDPIVIAKFFVPRNNWTRYATEFDPESRMFFWMVEGQETEMGYFSLDELENYEGKFGMGIERDIYFEPKVLSKVPLLKRNKKWTPWYTTI